MILAKQERFAEEQVKGVLNEKYKFSIKEVNDLARRLDLRSDCEVKEMLVDYSLGKIQRLRF